MEIKEIKHYFFAHRNGVTADVLKRGGSRFSVIFGVEVPAISRLAQSIGYNHSLARQLWSDDNVRESHLLAPWLIDPLEISVEDAVLMADGVKDMEDAMMLAFRVLKRHPHANEILNILLKAPDQSNRSLAASALNQHLRVD